MPAKARVEDYIGNVYGRLTVVKEVSNTTSKSGTRVLSRCSCSKNKTTVTYLYELLNGHTQSCGCLQKENVYLMAEANVKHGHTRNKKKHKNWKLYNCYNNMIDRCYNKNNTHYESYGGRGIKVCKEWKNNKDYAGLNLFVKWALSNGWKNNLKIDRKNNDKGYYPKNCRFITNKENSSNCQRTIFVRVKGAKMSLKQACEKLQIIGYSGALKRVHKGWEPLKAVTTPTTRR